MKVAGKENPLERLVADVRTALTTHNGRLSKIHQEPGGHPVAVYAKGQGPWRTLVLDHNRSQRVLQALTANLEA